jgi:NgoBV restriction endonuclease
MPSDAAKKMYEALLVEVENGLVGKITFKMNAIEFEINSKDGIGGHIQEWLEKWMVDKAISYSIPSNSQSFPDFFLHNLHDNKVSLLEVKSFDMDAGANFDIANFQSYCQSLATNPERIYSDYLIFGYLLNEGRLVIKNIWLKKIWEICCPSERFPLKTQVKRDVIYNIRPASWYASNPTYKPFKTKDDFVKALYDTEEMYLNRVSENKGVYSVKKLL